MHHTLTSPFLKVYSRRVILPFAVLLSLSSFTYAQTALRVTGSVTDKDSKGIDAATVALLKSTDSSFVKAELTDEHGHYEIATEAGSYMLRIISPGYSDRFVPAFTVASNIDLPVVVMEKKEVSLKEVAVVSKKPMIEIRADKTVFNVENSINATGSNALELLKKSPGMQVDYNDNITMKGKNGVKIYIDGKPTQLDAASLAAYLKSINSNDIEAIEMISNPSAKYDASGNAGIVNIRLKKNKKFGTNGSVNAGLVEGIRLKENGSLNLNYRDKKVNIFGDISYNGGKYENTQNLYRTVNNSIYDPHTVQIDNNNNVNVKAGADYYVNKNSTIGIVATTNQINGTWTSDGITQIYDSSHNYVSTLHAKNTIPGIVSNSNLNFNYRYTDTMGREYSVDADYGTFISRKTSTQPNNYDSMGHLLPSPEYKNNTPVNIDIYSLKADGEQNLWKGRFGYGVKFSYVKTGNVFDFYNVQNNADVLDPNMSNTFVYKENVNAAYVNYQKKMSEHWSLQAGLRSEQTNSEGELALKTGIAEPNDTIKRSYIDLFPSGALTWTLNKNNTLNLTYSRRIDRPTYEDLNPFEFKLDELTYNRGNAFLRPQYTDNYEMSHTFKGMLITTVGYAHVKDYAIQVLDTTQNGATFVQLQNLATQDIYSFSMGSPLPIKKWWNGYVNAWVNEQIVNGEVTGRKISLKKASYGGYMTHNFSLGKEYSAEISGWYNGPGVWGATGLTSAQGSMDLGLQKKFLDKKMIIKISITDVLGTASPWHIHSNFSGQTINGNGTWESRTVRLNFTYQFGSSQIKSASEHKTGLEAEKKRLKG